MPFQPALFWDIDVSCLDIVAHAGFIIERVVTRGNLEDWKMLLDLYGKRKIRDVVVRIRSLDSKSLHFLSVYFSVDTKEFRCCT